MEVQSRDSRMLTTAEVAKLLRVHANTVRHWANRELLRAYRLGPRRDRRFKHEDVESFIRRNNRKPQQPQYMATNPLQWQESHPLK